MKSHEDQPTRVIALLVPACEPERVAPEDRLRVEHLWAEVFAAVQRTVPGAVQLKPGHSAMRARGPTRYYGSETAAAQAVHDCVTGVLPDHLSEGLSIGVANGRFAAEQAALAASAAITAAAITTGVAANTTSPTGIHIIDAAHTTAFLSRLPIERAVGEEFAPVLDGLGVRTLGAFAALPEHSVLQRFGREAQLAHRRARGLGEPYGTEIGSGTAPHELSVSFEFEPPLEGVDQLAFACSGYAEKFVRGLGERALVCTELRVELIDDTQTSHERSWSHPANFTASDVLNRVRWQAASLPQAAERGGAGVAAVRITPERTAPAAAHEPGLWNDAPSERVHHQLTRVQSLLGPEGVGTGMVVGGRTSADRQRLVPWGAKRTSAPRSGSGDAPWPGKLQGPLPNLVATHPSCVAVLDAQDIAVTIDSDELFSAPPESFRAKGAPPRRVRGWSAPWPLREGWWHSDAPAEALYRVQFVLDNGEAWLLRYAASDGWAAEGRYT